MNGYDATLIAAVAVLVLLPARLDPAIRIKERQLRSQLRCTREKEAQP
jgi:hypothetical protein